LAFPLCLGSSRGILLISTLLPDRVLKGLRKKWKPEKCTWTNGTLSLRKCLRILGFLVFGHSTCLPAQSCCPQLSSVCPTMSQGCWSENQMSYLQHKNMLKYLFDVKDDFPITSRIGFYVCWYKKSWVSVFSWRNMVFRIDFENTRVF
jgi:hypothetical protein